MQLWISISLSVFITCFWTPSVASEFDLSHSQQQIIEWAKLNMLLDSEGSAFEENCTKAPEQTVSRYLFKPQNLFANVADAEKRMLEVILPRAKFYSAQIEPVEKGLLIKTSVRTTKAYDPNCNEEKVVYHKGTCSSCCLGTVEASLNRKLGEICKAVEKEYLPDPFMQPEEPS